MGEKTITGIFGVELTRFILEIENHIMVINMNHPPINVVDAPFEEEPIQICRCLNQEDDAWSAVCVTWPERIWRLPRRDRDVLFDAKRGEQVFLFPSKSAEIVENCSVSLT